jgi:hypothetical protein
MMAAQNKRPDRLRSAWIGVMAGLLGAAGMVSVLRAELPQDGKAKPQPTCGDYGTAIEFEASPKAAARRAAAEEKLVMVLHVSGHFEDPGLT